MGCVATFIICLIICALFAFFFAGILFSSFWVLVIFAALLLTLFVRLFLHYEDKIEALEKRLALLEGKPQADTEKGKTEGGEEIHEAEDTDGQPHGD